MKVVQKEKIEVISTHNGIRLLEINVNRLVATKEKIHTTVEKQLDEFE